MKKKIIIVFGVVLVLLVVAFLIMTNGLSEGRQMTLKEIDLANLSDGSYTGTYEQGRWTNTLTVHIEDNRISGIDIDQDVLVAGITDCSAELFQRVMEAQSTQVDVVAGATVTSKAYLLAIEHALSK